jgi:hypothetical protein
MLISESFNLQRTAEDDWFDAILDTDTNPCREASREDRLD